MFSQVTRALLSLDPFVWPLFGLALTSVGILLRKLRGLKPSAEQAFEPIELGLLVFFGLCLEEFGLQYGFAIASLMPLVFAVIYSFIFCVIRTVRSQWTTLVGSITTLGFLIATTLTMNIRYANWETASQIDVRNSLLPFTSLIGALCVVMCLVDLARGVWYRIRSKRTFGRFSPPTAG